MKSCETCKHYDKCSADIYHAQIERRYSVLYNNRDCWTAKKMQPRFYEPVNWKEISKPVLLCGLIECCRNRGGQCLIAGQVTLDDNGMCMYASTDY